MDGQYSEGVVRDGAHSRSRLAHGSRARGGQAGPGNLLRVVLVVMVIGVVFAAWFLLRGYKRED